MLCEKVLLFNVLHKIHFNEIKLAGLKNFVKTFWLESILKVVKTRGAE